jgi:hypothetical protein
MSFYTILHVSSVVCTCIICCSNVSSLFGKYWRRLLLEETLISPALVNGQVVILLICVLILTKFSAIIFCCRRQTKICRLGIKCRLFNKYEYIVIIIMRTCLSIRLKFYYKLCWFVVCCGPSIKSKLRSNSDFILPYWIFSNAWAFMYGPFHYHPPYGWSQ